MRYLVISPCEDARTGVPFAVGDEFLPEPEDAQAERLIKAGCLRVIPDDAPDLPSNPDAQQEVLALREQLERADQVIIGLNGRLADAATQYGEMEKARQGASSLLDDANSQIVSITTERDKLASRVTELEGLLAEATKPAVEASTAEEQPAKQGRKH